ncbi:ArsR/SmtB family transcription factor [Citrifermentans bremense]|uniref:ArsR/SmtB family transcription factor n=1 Tax=Citrifermentans bremense TaxID=60035 RepID=UPI0006859FA5|nr:metalloregulator ArsR/SmtB family transcription factor [Citrifermentans bremense]
METISAYSAEVLRLLGQITRLMIVEALREKELYVSEIFTILEEEQSNVSKHLSQMAQNGILGTRKDPDSPKCYYRVKLTGIFGIIDLAKRLVERERDGVQGVAALPFVAGVLKEIGQPSRMAIPPCQNSCRLNSSPVNCGRRRQSHGSILTRIQTTGSCPATAAGEFSNRSGVTRDWSFGGHPGALEVGSSCDA